MGAENIENRVAICVLTHNRREDLRKTLKRIRELENLFTECLVLDNGSSDGTTDMIGVLAETFPKLRNFRSEENLGVSKGRNFLWERTEADLILALDDDIIINSRDFKEILEEYKSSNLPCIVSPQIIEDDTGRILNDNKVFWKGSTLYEACFLLPREIIEKVGMFDPALSVAAEGQDYAIRVRRAGFKIHRIDSATVIHVQRERSNIVNKERRLEWLRSFSYVYFKNLSITSATLKISRLFLSMSRHDLVDFGFRHIFSLLKLARKGAVEGMKVKSGRDAPD
ncbi:hypothetical protein B6V74_18485 [Thioclava sp. F42-5]|uniref:glycosyltransferase family 2 protein n=1 Tax=Thioclava sp. F42-5 TaxID=1973005 RepID=UPI000B53F8FB|nr:glycosyltransferase [Thioclava sp. F42-5]OWY07400.1 hypothetical protein B6V74_18485 [Thioclava sp. F42-5]